MTGILDDLRARGFHEQSTDPDALGAALVGGSTLTFYIGFDPTAASLHVGSLLQIMLMRRLQKAGHRPICLVGGGTARVGDPSGKTETRKLMTADRIGENVAGLRGVFARFLDFDAAKPNGALLLDNADWLLGLGYVEFLRDIGRHFTVNRMIAVKTYRDRLEAEQPLSFLEFNYQLLQAYDFLHLHRRHDCTLQIGGSDQWGNIVAGIELIRRCRDEGEGAADLVHGLTTPLITVAGGQKMGKTERGAVWLDPALVSPFDYYQFWVSCDDRDVGKLLRLYTEIPTNEIDELVAGQGQALNEAKRRLAYEATMLCHGQIAALAAQSAATQAFGGGDDWSMVPLVEIEDAETTLLDLVVHPLVAAFKSRREARQRIVDGGVRIDGVAVTDPSNVCLHGREPVRVQIGKKKRLRVALGGGA
jgi:tyrosyl-tRNA synthetase